MGQLVPDHVQDPHSLCGGGDLLVDQEHRFPVGDASEVLHGAEGEVGDRHHVDLVAGVGDAVVVRQVVEAEPAAFERESGQVHLSLGRDDAEGHAVHIGRSGRLEGAHHEGNQVGGHHDGVGEGDRHPAVPERRPLDLGAVRNRHQIIRDYQGDPEGGLEVGLVPAREGAAGVGGLELGGGDDLLGPALVLERGPVEAPELVVQDPRERAAELPSAGRQGLGDAQVGPLPFLVIADLGVDPGVAAHESSLIDPQFGGVEHHPVGRLDHIHCDHFRPGEGGGIEVGFHPQSVVAGDDSAGQPVGMVVHCDSKAREAGREMSEHNTIRGMRRFGIAAMLSSPGILPGWAAGRSSGGQR